MSDGVTVDDLSYAKKQLLQSSMRLASIKKYYYMDEKSKPPDEISVDDFNEVMLAISPIVVITDCQVCVELAVKAMFKSVGVNPIQKHDIDFSNDRVAGLLSNIPKSFKKSEEVPRAIFLTQFWERFYTLAKYGIPEKNLSSRDLMTVRDAKRAVRDAEFCLDVSTQLHEHMLGENDLELEDLELALPKATIEKHS